MNQIFPKPFFPSFKVWHHFIKDVWADEGKKMNQGKWLVSFLILNLIFIIVLGCSSDKAFKTGVTYICDGGKSFEVEVFEQVDTAFLKIEEKRFYLPRVTSESGKKYSDGSITLWFKGEGASVEIEGRSEFKNCTVKPE